jgi:hypothetical protein
MSAFLKYSQTRRAKVKEDNPDMSNTDVSRLLGEMWRNASPHERAPYVKQEECERAVYKENLRKWRDDQARMDAASRTSHQTMQHYQHHQHPNYQHHQHPQPQPMERSYRPGIFESLPMDSFEEPAKKSTFGHQYSNPNPSYQQYRHPYNPSVGTSYIKDKSMYPFVSSFYSLICTQQMSPYIMARNSAKVIYCLFRERIFLAKKTR